MKALASVCLACGMLFPLRSLAEACRSSEVCIRIDGANVATGRIVGIVEDRGTSKPLDFANVVVPGTVLGAMSRNGGRFHLNDLSPGLYRIKAQFVGYEPQTVDGVQVTPNTTTVLKLCLDKSVEGCRVPAVIVTCTHRVAVAATRMESPHRRPARAVSILPKTEIIPRPVASVEEDVALNTGPRPAPPAAKHMGVQVRHPALMGSNASAGSRGVPTLALSEEKSPLDECGCNQAKPLVVAKAAPARPAGARVLAEDLPKVTRLRGNFPNPFNPSTKIRFDLAHRGRVDLVIFDLRGRRVRTLLRAEMEPGRPEVVWDGKDDAGKPVASGMYIYRLVTGTFRDTRKLMVVR